MKTIIQTLLALGLLCLFADLANGGMIVDGGGHTTSDSSVVTNVPFGNDFTAIAAGCEFGLALRSNGTAISREHLSWEGGGDTAIVAGGRHWLELHERGMIEAWGEDTLVVPVGDDYTAIAAGWAHSLALAGNGSIVAWGNDNWEQVSNAPTGFSFAAIAGGAYSSLGLRQDKSWGGDIPTVTNVPSRTGSTYISAGSFSGAANRSTAPLPETGKDDTVYVDGQVTGLTGEQTVDAAIIGDGGTLEMPDSGTLTTNDGITVDQGQGAFTTEFEGDFSQSTDGTLMVEIGGYIQGKEYNFIHVTGSTSLEGSIDVSLIDGFLPNLGDAFTIMTADSGITIGEAGLSIVGDGRFSWRIVDGKSLQIVSATEPAVFVLLAVAAILLAGFWRLRS